MGRGECRVLFYALLAVRGQAYVFQSWWALDAKFIENVTPPNLKVVNPIPKSSIPAILE